MPWVAQRRLAWGERAAALTPRGGRRPTAGPRAKQRKESDSRVASRWAGGHRCSAAAGSTRVQPEGESRRTGRGKERQRAGADVRQPRAAGGSGAGGRAARPAGGAGGGKREPMFGSRGRGKGSGPAGMPPYRQEGEGGGQPRAAEDAAPGASKSRSRGRRGRAQAPARQIESRAAEAGLRGGRAGGRVPKRRSRGTVMVQAGRASTRAPHWAQRQAADIPAGPEGGDRQGRRAPQCTPRLVLLFLLLLLLLLPPPQSCLSSL